MERNGRAEINVRDEISAQSAANLGKSFLAANTRRYDRETSVHLIGIDLFDIYDFQNILNSPECFQVFSSVRDLMLLIRNIIVTISILSMTYDRDWMRLTLVMSY